MSACLVCGSEVPCPACARAVAKIIPPQDDPTTVRIRAAIEAKRTGIEMHEGPKPGPTCPRCRYDWLLCPCPGDIFFNNLEPAK